MLTHSSVRAGLVNLFGSKEAFINKLNQLFTADSTVTGDDVSSDITGLIGQYAHGNEPSHHITHIYNVVGRHWRTQELVDQILKTMYFNDPNGLSGNEDCGQMSAWYVLNAMGFYSFCPGSSTYSIGRPLFDEVEIALPDGKSFTIIAKDNSSENKYIQSARLNDQTMNQPFFTHDEIIKGGTIHFEMGDSANRSLFNNK